jgi:conjugal transfer ATP-binding protein TraC
MPRSASIIDKLLKRYRLSDLTPILSPTEDNFFFCENSKKKSYIGACFASSTLNGISQEDFDLFYGSISSKLPADTIIQFTQVATGHIESDIDAYYRQKEFSIKNNPQATEQQKSNLLTVLRSRVKYLRSSMLVSPISPLHPTLRENRLLVSVKVPTDLKVNEYELERAKEQIYTVYDNLKNSILLDIRHLSKFEFIAQARAVFYPFSPYDSTFDENQLVSEQILKKTTKIDNRDPNFLKIDDSFVSVLSVSSLPSKNNISLMQAIVGDSFGGTKQIPCPFLINCTIIIPDIEKARFDIDLAYTYTQDAATPFALKMAPSLRKRLDGLTVMYNDIRSGEIPCKLFFNIVLFHKDKFKLPRIAATLENYYKSLGLSVVPDNKIVLPLFWNTVPLYPSIESLKNLNRIFTMTTKAAATFAPLFSDFTNLPTSQASQIYTTRRGNLYGFDPMKGRNHNGIIVGTSGSGKSATANNMIQQEYESQAMIRIIDNGRSYKKLTATLGGAFIEFTPNSNICLNPFTIIDDIDEEKDQISRVIKQMASPTEDLSQYVMTVIKKAVVSSFGTSGKKTNITDVADFLTSHQDTDVKRVGEQLYEYTDRGSYGRYFNGDNNLDLTNQMIVLELSGLQNEPQLQTVVMMVLLARIQNDMYHNRKYPRKFLFFEEVTSYLKIDIVAEYISDFFARIRKSRGGCWLVTQNLESVAKSETISTIINNATFMVYLPYKASELNQLVEGGYIKNDPYIIKNLQSLRLSPNQFSEAMIFEDTGGSGNMSTVRIVLSDSEKILFSSSDEYFQPFLDRMDAGESIKDILESYLIYEKEKLSAKGSHIDIDVAEFEELITSGEIDLHTALIDFKKRIINRTQKN